MKTRFSTLDIQAIVKELQRFLGMRVANVYDIDSKTYMVKLAKPDMKAMILIESGNRLHSTDFDWPKNPAPSGFSMKLRKHLRGRRIEVIQQFGIDRIVDLQFGSGEAAYHLIIELYDRGNLVLTDCEYTILNILRPRTDESQDVRFAVRECYPIHTTKQFEKLSENRLRELLLSGKEGDNLKKILMPNLEFGPALLEHCLRDAGFTDGGKIGSSFNIDTDFSKLYSSLVQGEVILNNLATSPSKGYIIQKSEKRAGKGDGQPDVLLSYDEFHPYLFKQHIDKTYLEFEFFDKAVDEYFSKIEGQRLDSKALQQEKSALKKLDNVKKDQEKRLGELRKEQEGDFLKGQLIEMNLDLVDRAILVVRSALANQIDWTEIDELVKDAKSQDDPVAAAIKSLRLDLNHITMLLSDPYSGSDQENDSIKPMRIEIDLGLSAYANSRRYFDKKKKAVVKEHKTMDSSAKAFKSAEKKTIQTLKDVATAVSINKTRKTYWFEKFLFFISSENFLVIGGRDQQQNELIVKRYLRPGDVYVHADLHGASSVIIKNNTANPIPPKTLNEAGTMAICNSAAWDAKVVTSAWWVHPDQVSKTAPTGEYLSTGSFMVRGKKNYLPPSYLVYGFGFLFKLEESSVSRHAGERKIRVIEGEITDTESEVTLSEIADSEEVIEDLSDSDSEEEGENIQALGELTEESITAENEMKEDTSSKMLGETDGNTQTKSAIGKFQMKTEGQDSTSEHTIQNVESNSDENIFPDTSINLQHVKGDKFSYQSQPSQQEPDENDMFSTDPNLQIKQQGAKLTAKQRRDMKKNKKSSGTCIEDEVSKTGKKSAETHQEVSKTGKKSAETHQEVSKTEKKSAETQQEALPCEETHVEGDTATDEAGLTQTQAKRGQKSKQKKMKEKYGDQDDEERQLRMEILASAGQQKESKRKKKKKGRAPVEKVEVQNVQQQQNVKKHLELLKQVALINAEAEGDTKENTESVLKVQGKTEPLKEDEGSGSEDERGDKDDKNLTNDHQLLESLTGLPVTEDELLFAIPVCAPYQAINNYKYKVKLLPGSSKKGKATKTALNMFMHEKEASGREKDLMRIMKDVDVSRNIPGKVKVAAPKMSKMRRK